MDLAVTFKAHARDNISSANRQRKVEQMAQIAPSTTEPTAARRQPISLFPNLPPCQECTYPQGKPTSVLIQRQNPTLLRDPTTKDYDIGAYGPIFATHHDTIYIKADLHYPELIDRLHRHSTSKLPRMDNATTEERWLKYEFCVGGDVWKILDARTFEKVWRVMFETDGFVRLRIRAMDAAKGWKERERERLKREDERERERRKGCCFM